MTPLWLAQGRPELAPERSHLAARRQHSRYVRTCFVTDWSIENRSREVHTFHVHQLHFLVVNRRGTSWEEPSLRDTVNLAAWSGFGQYPSLTVRMDFRDPRIVGTFPFHCHIMQHLDGGMMGTVKVEAERKTE